ncbi:aa3-type cytochrome c oxidase subunit IV [Asticcacaulis sp. AND118]|uniref:aa3-type cytochrome c oxidase subunit IV n=1 Tax=Asticcacaulis sp. AND118 TaxID=2840468 RepID=UPI001CFFFE78|nr:aa3-type cytochrome c oxidase subunit IV [Asticcacaulis sp. AND118]UDF04452.1 aa3-type cytochrome c oxidase subunit IV [Asticcacaulis sp. AND118]
MAGHEAGDYHKGEMDIHEQSETYDLFMGLTKWGSLIIAVGLLFFVLWFAVKGAGFVIAAAVSVVVAVIGFLLLKKKPDAH